MTETTTTTIPAGPYKFGDRVEMIAASPDNPHKFGFFVRRVHHKRTMNGGSFIEVTDGNGDMWETPPDNVRPAPSAAQGWMPIETAPKDGTPVLIWGATLCVPGEMVVGIRSDEHDDLELWDIHDGKHGPHRLRGPSPTHWMPLPAAPGAQPAQPDAEERGVTETALDHVRQFIAGTVDLPSERTISVDYADGDEFLTNFDQTPLTLGDLRALSAARASAPEVVALIKAAETMLQAPDLHDVPDADKDPETVDAERQLRQAVAALRSAGEGK